MASRRHTSERDAGYSRDDGGDRRERDSRTARGEREAGARTPVRTTPEVRPTTLVESRTVTAIDPRSAVQARPVAESRDTRGEARAVVDPRSTRDSRDTAYGRDPRAAVESSDRRPTDTGRDLPRESRAAPPVVTRDHRDPRSRPEEVSPRPAPTNDYFLPGEDISREVITADICRYLGPDALVRPYRHQDGRSGYLITAYRALTSAMIKTLKQDSIRFEADNRRRVNAGHRPQSYAPSAYAPSAYDPSSRMDAYEDRNAVSMGRVDSRYANDPEPRRSRPQAYGDDDMDLDMDPLVDSRDPRYSRETYDSRDSRARPQVSAGYAQPGRDPYPFESRTDPRLDSRTDRLDSRTDPRLDSRADPRIDPRQDPRVYPQAAPMPVDRDYPMGDSWPAYGDPRGTAYGDPRTTSYGDSRGTAYGDSRGTAQPVYPSTRHDPYGAPPPSQAGAIPRGARDEGQVYIDPRTGRPMMANNPDFDSFRRG